MRTNQIIRLESNGNRILPDFKVLFSKLKSENIHMEDSNGKIYNKLVFLLRKFNCTQAFFINFFLIFPLLS